MPEASAALDILLLEDNPLDAKVITGFMERSGFHCNWSFATTRDEYRTELYRKHFDLILSDHQLTNFTSFEALELRNDTKRDIPFILITSTISESIALEIIKRGATDYIFKSNLQRLPVAIKTALENKRMEKDYKRIRDRFELAARATVNVIWDYDLAANSIYFSEASKQFFDMEQDTVNPLQLRKYIHPDDLHRLLKSFWKAVENNTDRWNEIFKIITKDGELRNISAKSIIVRNKSKVERAVGVLQDITDVTNLQHRLLVQEVKKQKEISHISIKAQEKEREEIGKELHDNVNQLLAVAKVLLDAARTSLQAPNEFVEKSQGAIVQAIEEIRNISHAMIPPSFREDDFLDALKELISNINVSGKIRIEQHLPANGDLSSLDDERKLAVYRIVQEQLNNIMKHAKASKAALSLSKTDDLFIVIIEDDGIGIHPESGKKGIGLNNIEKRAQYFGGRMKVTSSPGAGFRLRVEIPLRS